MMGQERDVKPENPENGAGGETRARCRADPPCSGPCMMVRVAPGGPTLPWWKLAVYRRNVLKVREERDLQRLGAAMLDRTGWGFCFPIFVWAGHQYVIDGAGRMPALERLEAAGHVVPEVLPVTPIEAATEREAAELVLLASSHHGAVTEESLASFGDLHAIQLGRMRDVVAFQGVALEEVARRQVEFLARETPAFGEQGEQPRLDETNPGKEVTCPECGVAFCA